MGHFGAAHRWGEGWQKGSPFSKICHTYPTLMRLGAYIPYLKKIQKTHKSRDTNAGISVFYRKLAISVISGNTSIDCVLMHNF